jgi:hypothetical protein
LDKDNHGLSLNFLSIHGYFVSATHEGESRYCNDMADSWREFLNFHRGKVLKITEHQHQSSLMQWFGMKKLKDEGFMPGVADLFLMIPRGEYHGMFIEMKAEKGTLQTEQKEFLERADNQGYMAVTCYGFLEAKEAITQYLKGVK